MWSNHKNYVMARFTATGNIGNKRRKNSSVVSFLHAKSLSQCPPGMQANKGATLFFLSVVGLTVDSACEKTNQA